MGSQHLIDHVVDLSLKELNRPFGLLLVGQFLALFVQTRYSGVGLVGKVLEVFDFHLAIQFGICVECELPISL